MEIKQIYHLLARSVIIKESKILLARESNSDFTFLPGGHVEDMEWVVDGLKRELQEELHLGSIIKHYLGMIEYEFNDKNGYNRELGHYFLAEVPGIVYPENPEAFEERLEFLWCQLEDIEKYDLRPTVLINKIYDIKKKGLCPWYESLSQLDD